jgi:hypothetical protein
MTSSLPDGVDLSPAGSAEATTIVTTNELRKVLNERKAQAVSGDALVVCAAVDKLAEEVSFEM